MQQVATQRSENESSTLRHEKTMSKSLEIGGGWAPVEAGNYQQNLSECFRDSNRGGFDPILFMFGEFIDRINFRI